MTEVSSVVVAVKPTTAPSSSSTSSTVTVLWPMLSPVSGSVISQSSASGRASCPARAALSTSAVPVAVLPGVSSTVTLLSPSLKMGSTASLEEAAELSTVSNSPGASVVMVSPSAVSVTGSLSSTVVPLVTVSVVTVSWPVSLPLSWMTRPSSSSTVVSVVVAAPSTTGSSPSGLAQVISVVMVVVLPSSLAAASVVPAAKAGTLDRLTHIAADNARASPLWNFLKILGILFITAPFHNNVTVDLVPPDIPALRLCPGEQLDPGDIAHEPDDALPRLLGFPAVFLDVGEDHLMDAGGHPAGVPPCGKEADLGVGPRPVPQPPEQTVRLLVLLDPDEGRRLVGEAPALQDGQPLPQGGTSPTGTGRSPCPPARLRAGP